jgi:hypothetical protein
MLVSNCTRDRLHTNTKVGVEVKAKAELIGSRWIDKVQGEWQGLRCGEDDEEFGDESGG